MSENRSRSIEEFYKTLLFLNESTEDYFFLWDMEDQTFHFARELLTGCGCGSGENLVFDMELIERTIYEGDRARVKNILQNAVDGTISNIDSIFRYLDSKGRRNRIRCKGKVMRDDLGNPYVVIGCLSRKMLSDRMDMLTGLFNVNQMMEDMNAALSSRKSGHLLILGIDDFKDINQLHGREYGDLVLKKAADCLEDIRKEQYQVYRLEGDCFAVNLFGCSPREVVRFYDEFRKKFSDEIMVSGGSAAYPVEGNNSIRILIRRAEEALDRAKSSGKNRLYHFTEEGKDGDFTVFELKQELWQSIQDGCRGFELYYQPQVTSGEHRLYGAEALLRYHSDKHGFLSPVKFIPVLEESGMIVDVGRWVMHTAFLQCAKWRETDSGFHISVNLSYVQLREGNILEDVLRELQYAGLPGEAVTLEITESIQLRDFIRNNSLFRRFREHGIRVSIDDFGTGYSSLNYLKSLEVDEVKIDRCFIRQIHKSAYGYRLLSNILELTRGSTIQVCCEGVEEKEELRCIDNLKPELIQGFLFSRPLPAGEFEQTRLVPDGSYRSLLDELQQEKNGGRQEEAWKNREQGYREILNSIRNILYIVDTETDEICYMNSAAKNLMGTYEYHGHKCYEVLWGRTRRCENCNLTEDGLMAEEIREKYFTRFGHRVTVSQRSLEWNGRPMKLINVRALGEDSFSGEAGVREDLQTAQQVNRMYEQAACADDRKGCIDAVMTYLGKQYEADRAELFLLDRQRDFWTGCYHYLDKGVMPKARHLETATGASMEPWVRYVNHKKVFFVKDCMEPEPDYGELCYGFRIQNIRNCMMCGLWDEGELAGILTMDNVASEKESLFLLKKGAELLQKKLFGRKDAEREISRMIESSNAHEILSSTRLGLWQIRINRNTGERVLLTDDIVKNLLQIPDEFSPKESYEYWSSRIASGYNYYVNSGVESMIVSDRIVESEYTWNHPQKGALTARCVGSKTAQSPDCILLEGYFRFNDDMNRVKSMSENYYFEHLEYHEKKHMAYFHTARSILYGSRRQEENFPAKWVEQELVHPEEAELFLDFFKDVASRKDKQYMKVRLLNKSREYIWFHVEAYRIGRNEKDMDSMLVVMLPERQPMS